MVERSYIELNKQICRAADDELPTFLRNNIQYMNLVNCVTCLQRWCKLSISRNEEDLCSLLLEVARQLEATSNSYIQPRHVSTCLWSCCNIRTRKTTEVERGLKKVFSCAAEVGEKLLQSKSNQFKSQEISICMWSMAKIVTMQPNDEKQNSVRVLKHFMKSLLNEFISCCRQINLSGQSLANGCWAVATLNIIYPELSPQLISSDVIILNSFSNLLDEMKPQELSNLIWAFAKINLKVEPSIYFNIFQYLNRSRFIETFRPQHIVNILWGLESLLTPIASKVSRVDDGIVAFSNGLCRRISDFNGTELVMILTTIGLSSSMWEFQNEQANVAKATFVSWISSLQRFSCVEFVHTTVGFLDFISVNGFSFVTPGRNDEELLKNAFACHRNDFSIVEVSSLLGSLPKLVDKHIYCFLTNEDNIVILLERFVSLLKDSSKLPLKAVVNSLCGFVKLKLRMKDLQLDIILDYILKIDLNMATPRDLSILAWSLSMIMSSHTNSSASNEAILVMKKISDVSQTKLSQFNAQECSKLLFALEKSGCSDIGLISKAQQAREENFIFSRKRKRGGTASLKIKIYHKVGGGRDGSAKELIGTTKSTGIALWDASVFMADWLANHLRYDSRATNCINSILDSGDVSLSKHDCVIELGAGTGLPSMLAYRSLKQRVSVFSTDGDLDTLAQLDTNCSTLRKSSNRRELHVQRLQWGNAEDVKKLLGEMKAHEISGDRIIIGCGILYGSKSARPVWKQLLKTLLELTNQDTYILFAHGQGAAPGVHETSGYFFEKAKKHYRVEMLHYNKSKGSIIHLMVPESMG